MNPLRIAHILPSFHIGGQERVALDLASSHRAQGHHVLAFAIDPPEGAPLADAFRAAGVVPGVVPKRRGFDLTQIVRLSKVFSRERIDVVHTHNPLALTYGAPAGKLAGAVVVHTKHGENLEAAGMPRRLLVRRIAARFADAFVAVSPMTAAAARKTRDVSERKLRVIANGIDVHRFAGGPEARAAARRELGIPDGARVIGTVGRVAPEKNQVILVRALAADLGEALHLVVIGDGPETPALGRAVAEAGAGPFVHLPGARSDVHRLLPALDVFALPSLTEGLPLSILEAMAAGLPVVASSVGGLPDVVGEGETGYLVPPGDAAALREKLVALARDPAAAAAMGARARALAVARHSLEAVSDAYMQLYLQLLGNRALGVARAQAAGGGGGT